MAFEHDRFAALNTVEHVDWSNATRTARPVGPEHGSELERAVTTLEGASTHNIDQLDELCRQLSGSQNACLDDDLLSETNQAIEQLRTCAADLREQAKSLHEAFAVIERSFAGRKPPSARLRAALKRGSKMLARVKVTQGRYWLIEAELAREEMMEAEFHCNQKLRKITELEERIASIDKQRNKLDGFRHRVFRRASTRQKIERLEQRRKSVRRKLRQEALEIEDADLQRWLGVLLGASLHSGPDTWWQHTQRARELWYRLVSTRSWNMTTTARPRNDADPAPGTDATFEVDRRGQRFIASAFSHQREQLRTHSEPVARDRIARIEEVRTAMTSEFKEFVAHPA